MSRLDPEEYPLLAIQDGAFAIHRQLEAARDEAGAWRDAYRRVCSELVEPRDPLATVQILTRITNETREALEGGRR